MNLLVLQSLDQAGGGSRASLRSTLRALRDLRPDWNLSLFTHEEGPLGRLVSPWGVNHVVTGMPHYRNHFEQLAYWLACRRMSAVARPLLPDVVLSNEWVTAPHAFQVARHLGIPAMSYVRDFAALQRGRKYQLHRMDRLLCVCESMRQALIGAGYDSDRLSTVYNPVLRPALHEPASDVRARISRHTGVDRWLLYLGRVSPRKNQIAAVETLKYLREITHQRWGLLLAGDADEAYAAEVDQAVAAAGLNDAVLPLGMIAQPGWLFELATASIMTSRSEGLARVLIESLLCGKPAFAFLVDGLEDIYGDELPYYVAQHRSPAELASLIASAMAGGDALGDRTEKLRIPLETRHSLENHVLAFEQAVARDGR